LKEGTGDFYYSKEGEPNKDWILFEVEDGAPFIAKSICIRNRKYDDGIKTISMSIGDDVNNLNDWITINHIHRKNRNLQVFAVDVASSYFLWWKQPKYIKLRVMENHGDSVNNAFYEFGILGKYSQ